MTPGHYELEVTALDQGVEWRGRADATVKAGSTTEVAIVVHRTVATNGRVVSADGVPVKGATVEVFAAADTNRDPIADVQTDEHGRYEVRGLKPGDYLVRARHVRWIEVSRRESIRGDRRLVDCVLGRQGATLEVTVRDAEERPIQNARIDLYRKDGSYLAPDRDKYERDYFAKKRANPDLTYEAAHRAHTVTNAEGRLTRRFLPAGTVRVVAEADDRRAEATVTLRPDGRSAATITFDR